MCRWGLQAGSWESPRLGHKSHPYMPAHFPPPTPYHKCGWLCEFFQKSWEIKKPGFFKKPGFCLLSHSHPLPHLSWRPWRLPYGKPLPRLWRFINKAPATGLNPDLICRHIFPHLHPQVLNLNNSTQKKRPKRAMLWAIVK
jgi:hypothetical protein